MKIVRKKYVIATREHPLQFDDSNGYGTDYIDEAYLYDDQEDAERVLNTFDDPNEHQVLPIEITYKI